jgi:hypothetical protein
MSGLNALNKALNFFVLDGYITFENRLSVVRPTQLTFVCLFDCQLRN